MKYRIIIFTTLLAFSHSLIQAQESDSTDHRFHVGSSLFMLFNLTSDSPNFYQLNLGYKITQKDEIGIELITWEYGGPLGRQYGPDFENSDYDFPGRVQALGAGLTYKRFLGEKTYVQIHSTALHQNYLDENRDKIQSGFQLFNTFRFGYQFWFLEDRLFLKPSIGITFWPINTNLPDSFQEMEDQFPNYFLGEPGLHFGFNF